MFGCKQTKDPITEERAYSNFRDILDDILEDDPGDPWFAKDEIWTTKEYEAKLDSNRLSYLAASRNYYQEVEGETFILLHQIKELAEYNADEGEFEITYPLMTAKTYSDNIGPDFTLYIPRDISEDVHYYNQREYLPGLLFSTDARNGGLSQLTLNAKVARETAQEMRSAATDSNVYLRMEIRIDFPPDFEGYRFHSDRLAQMYDQERISTTEDEKKVQEEDLIYGGNQGKIVISIIRVSLIDEDGKVFHTWPEELQLAGYQTPTPSQTAVPSPTFVIPTSVSSTSTPTSTETFEPEFCSDAPTARMTVGQKGRVTDLPEIPVNVRSSPQISPSNIVTVIDIGSQFLVTAGPECADSYVWWEIEFGRFSGVWIAEGVTSYYFIEPLEE